LISRQETLKQAHDELKNKQEVISKTTEQERGKNALEKKEQYNRNLQLNNESTAKSEMLQNAKTVSAKIQDEVVRDENEHQSHMQKTYQMILNIENLYQRCVSTKSEIKHKWKKMAPKDKEGKTKTEVKLAEMSLKLNVIANYLQDFQIIVYPPYDESRTDKKDPKRDAIGKKIAEEAAKECELNRSKAAFYYSTYVRNQLKDQEMQKPKKTKPGNRRSRYARQTQDSRRPRPQDPNASNTSNAGMASVSSTDMSAMGNSYRTSRN
jgi:hypothetical protein